MKLKKVKIILLHEDCWTSNTNEELQTLNLQVYPDKYYLRSRIAVNGDFKSLLRNMRRHKSIVRINKIWRLEDKKKAMIDFLNIYKGSVAGYLYDMQVLFLGNTINIGREVWNFVASDDEISEIINGLNSLGKVEKVSIRDFKPISLPSLSEIEVRVLRTAIEKGYLKYPRENDASTIASLLGISKVTFLYHLRNIQRKILEFASESYIDLEDDNKLIKSS